MTEEVMFGRTRLENMDKVIGDEGEQILKGYLKRNGTETKKLTLQYEEGTMDLNFEGDWVRWRYKR